MGPDAVRIASVNLMYNLFEQVPSEEIKTGILNRFSPENKQAKYIEQIVITQRKIARKMAETMRDGWDVIILSGDHSNASGFIAGMREAMPEGKIGLIWIDAHGDIHSPFTSPSGNMHGMPIAVMLGLDHKEAATKKLKPKVVENWEKLKCLGPNAICPKLHPEDITFIAIRDLEKQEWAAVHGNKIKYHTPEDLEKNGMEKTIHDVIESYKDYDAVYVSFDADSLDPSISRGTGTPVENGLTMDQAKRLIRAFSAMPNCRAVEVTEVNPLLDQENRMATAISKILRESLILEG